MVDLRQKLRDQLHYLENSSSRYDAGQKSEAIRIATVIRVLLHDTQQSTSLLTYLNARQVKLLSTVLGQPDPEMKFFHGMGMAHENPNKSRELIPNFNKLGIKSLLATDLWWNETVIVLESKEVLTRKKIVLAAANQDGGAHIDLKVSSDYLALAKDGAAGNYVCHTESGQYSATADNFHLVALRQMGFELLNSPDLLKLRS